LEKLKLQSSGYFDNSKTITYWNIGMQILDYLEVNKITENYGKRVFEKIFSNNRNIFLKTYYRDKYTRFLGDIYYSRDTNLKILPENVIFLNQELIDKELSSKYYK
jgi:hypothetical protein